MQQTTRCMAAERLPAQIRPDPAADADAQYRPGAVSPGTPLDKVQGPAGSHHDEKTQYRAQRYSWLMSCYLAFETMPKIANLHATSEFSAAAISLEITVTVY